MRVLDFIFFIGYRCADKNGFGDAKVIYAEIVLSAVLYFLLLSTINVIEIMNIELSIGEISKVAMVIPVFILWLIVVLVYRKRRVIAIQRFQINERFIKWIFWIIILLPLFFLYITTVVRGPQY